MRKTNLATIISETIFCYYFMGMDRTLIYQENCLIMALGDNAENSIIIDDGVELEFEEFNKIAKRMFITLIDELQGN